MKGWIRAKEKWTKLKTKGINFKVKAAGLYQINNIIVNDSVEISRAEFYYGEQYFISFFNGYYPTARQRHLSHC